MNKVLPVMLGVATTGVPDFLMATRFFGCAWFFSTSSRLAASVCNAVSAGEACGFFVSVGCWPDKPCSQEDENVPPGSGDFSGGGWGPGAEMTVSSPSLSPRSLVAAVVGLNAGKPLLEF